MTGKDTSPNGTLRPYLSPLAVWALSVGTAIGWIVDTTTIGATIVYGFASFAVFKASKLEGRKRNRLISGVCLECVSKMRNMQFRAYRPAIQGALTKAYWR